MKQKATLIAHCLERNEDKAQSHEKKHQSLIWFEDTEENLVDLHQNPNGESKPVKKSENKAHQLHLETDKQLPADVIEELNAILQNYRSFDTET